MRDDETDEGHRSAEGHHRRDEKDGAAERHESRDARTREDREKRHRGRSRECCGGDRQRNPQLPAGEEAERPGIRHRIAEQGLHQNTRDAESRPGEDRGEHARQPDVEHDLPGHLVGARAPQCGKRLGPRQRDLSMRERIERQRQQRGQQKERVSADPRRHRPPTSRAQSSAIVHLAAAGERS